jgi:hypothetical protein
MYFRVNVFDLTYLAKSLILTTLSYLIVFGNLYAQQPTVSIVTADSTADNINKEVWRRFVNKFNIINDYTALDGAIYLPTTEECLQGKPNALGWWSPIENGSMFGGLYMDGAIKRWEVTKRKEDADKVKRIANGLMLLASISSIEGFIGRGVTTDGHTHYPMGSDDQAGGWFYGMWRYLETTLPSIEERKKIEEKILSCAKAIVKENWFLPAEPPFNTRGSFRPFDYRAARMLFVAKISFLISKDSYWHDLYWKNLSEENNSKLTRLQILEAGLPSNAVSTDTWHNSPSVACLRSLWELETDSVAKKAFKKGLEITAVNALASLNNAYRFNLYDTTALDINWRVMNSFWKLQTNEIESQNLAMVQLRDLIRRCNRRVTEAMNVREPIFAAWLVTLSPDSLMVKKNAQEIFKMLNRYRYHQLFHVWFFPAEATWWRLRQLD